ncbi:hypothetical protein KY289_023546 [Solanum tuberosum]|nr:hypothetical protein KY289_023546 [Solanum tuberosum]
MTASPSSQPVAVGETNVNPNSKISYAATLKPPQMIQKLSKDTLKPIEFIHGEPTVRFTMEEREQFAREEGLHQAVIIKFAYGNQTYQNCESVYRSNLMLKGIVILDNLIFVTC